MQSRLHTQKVIKQEVPMVAQWIKEPVFPQLWLRSQLQLGFNSWPGKFYMTEVRPKTKPKKKKNKEIKKKKKKPNKKKKKKTQNTSHKTN